MQVAEADLIGTHIIACDDAPTPIYKFGLGYVSSIYNDSSTIATRTHVMSGTGRLLSRLVYWGTVYICVGF